MAAAGVRSSGAGLEAVPFSSPVVAVGRFEIWARDVDRQLISAIAHDVEVAMTALRQHGRAGAPQRSTLQPRLEAVPSSNQPGAADGPAGDRSQLGLQARLLARSAHWTAAVEAALTGIALGTLPLQSGGGSSSRTGATSDARTKPEVILEEILSSILLRVDSWVEELCQPGGLTAYNAVATTALTTQALQQRDVLEELLKTIPTFPSAVKGSAVESELSTATSATVGDAPSSIPTASSAAFPKVEDGRSANLAETTVLSPFLWICHLRHYYTPPEDALPQRGTVHHPGGGNSGREEDQGQEFVPPPPPPLIRVGIGPWNIPYGFEYAGTLERLWLTPLSERSLLHAVHSAKVWPFRLLIEVNGMRS